MLNYRFFNGFSAERSGAAPHCYLPCSSSSVSVPINSCCVDSPAWFFSRLFSRDLMCSFAVALLCLKRNDSLPVSIIWQWCVSRSSSAFVNLASPKTVLHSEKVRLIVMMHGQYSVGVNNNIGCFQRLILLILLFFKWKLLKMVPKWFQNAFELLSNCFRTAFEPICKAEGTCFVKRI